MTRLVTVPRAPARLGTHRRAAGALALAAALAGCAGRAPAPGPADAADAPPAVGAADRRIAADLVDVLARIDGVAPDGTTEVRVTPQRGEPVFAAALEGALSEVGYAVAEGPDPGASGNASGDAASGDAVPVGYVVQRGGADGAATATYTVSLAEVQARRSWALSAGPDRDWTPAGPLYVRGADVAGLGSAAPASGSTSPDVAPADALAAAVPIPTRPAAPATAPERIAIDPVTGSPVYGGITRGAFGGPALPTERNVMDLGGSNFADLFVDYADVAERILVFPNDSERLGVDNKSIVAEVADRFDPERDVFSIVGCSLGPTSLPNGNERLALGRANRVKEELVQVGVPSERIVDEGCWAGDSSERFPSRGVVLTLRRQG